MPPRIKSVDHLIVDWNDANYFDHPHADIGPDTLTKYLIRHGAGTEDRSGFIELTAAQGNLHMFNRDNRFDPQSSNQEITRSQLRTHHRAVLLAVNEEPLGGPFSGTATANTEAAGPRPQLVRPADGWPNTVRIGSVDYTMNTPILWRQSSMRFGFTPNIPVDDMSIPKGSGIMVRNFTQGRTLYMPWAVGPFRQGSTTNRQGSGIRNPFGQMPGTTGWDFISGRGGSGLWDLQPDAGDELEVWFIKKVKVLWEGIILNNLASQLKRQQNAPFKVFSKGYKIYPQEQPEFLETADTQLDTFLESKIPSSLYDANISKLNTMKVGLRQFPASVQIEGTQVNATGTTVLGMINAMARYACGFAVENSLGNVGIISWQKALDTTPTIEMDRTYKWNSKDAAFHFRDDWVRNRAAPEARFIQPGPLETLKSFDVDAGVLRAGNVTRVWDVDDLGESGVFGIQWPAVDASNPATRPITITPDAGNPGKRYPD